MHSITSKLNKDARQHQNNNGMTFFVSLGERNYDHKTKESVYSNYEAALFAKDNQVQYYTDNLKAGAVVSVGGTGLIIRVDPNGQYPPKLEIQDAKLEFCHNPGVAMPDNVRQQIQQPQQQQYQNTPQQPQQAPQYNQQQQSQQQPTNFPPSGDNSPPF